MAQFIIGFAAGVYIGTHYNCRPGLKFASQTFEQYCPKRMEGDEDYIPFDGEIISSNNTKSDETNKKEKAANEKVKAANEKVKEKAIELTSTLKKWF